MDYQGNQKSKREGKAEKVKPEKNIEKIVDVEVVVQRKTIWKKTKDIFLEADLKSVGFYVVHDVAIPAFRSLVADTLIKGIERAIYGEPAIRRRDFGRSRTTYTSYQTPVVRPGYSDYSTRYNPRTPMLQDPRAMRRSSREDFILSSREDAEFLVSAMNDILEQYDVVTVTDLNKLVGYPSPYTDNGWGWTYLGNVDIRQIGDHQFLIDFPPAEPI